MYNVEIITSRKFPFRAFPAFKQVSRSKYSAEKLTKKEAKKQVRRAKLRLMIAYYYDEKWERGHGYKKEWLLKNPSQSYRCVYCGRKIPYNSITLDHVVPIHAAKQSRFMQFILEKRGFKNIDDERNLVPSCYDCNMLKGKSNSFSWIVRAWLGQYTAYWIFLYLFGATLAAGTLYYLFLYLQKWGVI